MKISGYKKAGFLVFCEFVIFLLKMNMYMAFYSQAGCEATPFFRARWLITGYPQVIRILGIEYDAGKIRIKKYLVKIT